MPANGARKSRRMEQSSGDERRTEHSLAAVPKRHLTNLKSFQDERSLHKAADEVRVIWSITAAYLAAGAPCPHAVRNPDRAALVVVRTCVDCWRYPRRLHGRSYRLPLGAYPRHWTAMPGNDGLRRQPNP